jgi:transcriptional regulator with XRE-family HTH domain
MNAGRALRVLRAAKGLQQRDVALRAELDQSYVSLIESGKRKASPEAISALARALEVPVSIFELLAADDSELRGIKASQARELGRALAHAVSTKSRPSAPRSHAHR